MLSVSEARDKVIAAVESLSTETVSLPQALGRVLAEDLAARVTQPPVAVSAMDGYAVRADDLPEQPRPLKVIGMSQAGAAFEGPSGHGECVRIFTGAPMPEGCNAVIMQEDTVANGDQITFKEVAFEGKFVRRKGLDFAEGDILLSTGKRLSSRDIGLAAAMNIPWVRVRRKPRVAILATGDEIVMPGEALRPSQILSSNTLMMSAFVHALGAEPVNLGIAKDSEESLQSLIAGISGADMLVTTGGVSVGEFDLVQSVLGAEGMDVGFYKVAMKPGKPFMFGKIDGKPVLGLPGNPVSSFVTAFVFLRPALEKLQGLAVSQDKPVMARLTAPLGTGGPRPEYLRATLGRDDEGALSVAPVDGQDSAQLAQLAMANALILRDSREEAKEPGSFVPVLALTEGHLTI